MDIALLKYTVLGIWWWSLDFSGEWYPHIKKAWPHSRNKLYEAIFVELDKDVFHKNRNMISLHEILDIVF